MKLGNVDVSVRDQKIFFSWLAFFISQSYSQQVQSPVSPISLVLFHVLQYTSVCFPVYVHVPFITSPCLLSDTIRSMKWKHSLNSAMHFLYVWILLLNYIRCSMRFPHLSSTSCFPQQLSKDSGEEKNAWVSLCKWKCRTSGDLCTRIDPVWTWSWY